MLGILNDRYTNIQPTMPKYRAVCVFDRKAARIAFNYTGVEFVFAMNEETGTFVKCHNLHEVYQFLTN